MSEDIPVHPIQTIQGYNREQACLPQSVTLRAYEVYCHLYGEQPAMVTGGCRSGFGIGEITGFLYARSFPKQEWRARVDEAFNGMKGLK